MQKFFAQIKGFVHAPSWIFPFYQHILHANQLLIV